MAVRPNTYTNDGAKTTTNGINTTKINTGDSYRDALRTSAVSASQRDTTSRGGMNGMFNPGTVKGRNSVGEVVNSRSTTGQGANRVEAWRSANTGTTAPTTPYYGGGGGSSDGGGGGGGGGSAPNVDYLSDYLAQIRQLIADSRAKADELAKTSYDNANSENEEAFKQANEQTNLNKARAERSVLRSAPQGSYSMMGPLTRLNTNWTSGLNSNRRDFNNNKNSILSQYQQALQTNLNNEASARNTYEGGILLNRQNYLDQLKNQIELYKLQNQYLNQ